MKMLSAERLTPEEAKEVLIEIERHARKASMRDDDYDAADRHRLYARSEGAAAMAKIVTTIGVSGVR